MKTTSMRIAIISLLICVISINVATTAMHTREIHNYSLNTIQTSLQQSQEEVSIVVDDLHNSIRLSDLSDLSSTLNTTYGDIVSVGTNFKLNSSAIDYYDVLMILAPRANYTESERAIVRNYVNRGNSLFIAADVGSKTVLNPIISSYGLMITDKIITDDNRSDLLVNSFTYPELPVTEDINQVRFANGTSLVINRTMINNTLAGATIKDVYPLMSYGSNNTEVLGAAVEFTNHARVVISGSLNMFNNTYMDNPNPTEEDPFLDNTELVKNSIDWLARLSGNLDLKNIKVTHDEVRIRKGTTVGVNCTVERRETKDYMENVVVMVYLERTESKLAENYFTIDNTTYTGSISTTGVSSGWVNIHVRAYQRGYYIEDEIVGRVFIEEDPQAIVANSLFIISILGATAIIFFISVFFIWKKLTI